MTAGTAAGRSTHDQPAQVDDDQAVAAEPEVDLRAAVDPRAPRVGPQLAVGLTAAAAVGIVTIAVQARGGSLATFDEAVKDGCSPVVAPLTSRSPT